MAYHGRCAQLGLPSSCIFQNLLVYLLKFIGQVIRELLHDLIMFDLLVVSRKFSLVFEMCWVSSDEAIQTKSTHFHEQNHLKADKISILLCELSASVKRIKTGYSMYSCGCGE